MLVLERKRVLDLLWIASAGHRAVAADERYDRVMRDHENIRASVCASLHSRLSDMRPLVGPPPLDLTIEEMRLVAAVLSRNPEAVRAAFAEWARANAPTSAPEFPVPDVAPRPVSVGGSSVEFARPCRSCGGSGVVEAAGLSGMCPHCNGAGRTGAP